MFEYNSLTRKLLILHDLLHVRNAGRITEVQQKQCAFQLNSIKEGDSRKLFCIKEDKDAQYLCYSFQNYNELKKCCGITVDQQKNGLAWCLLQKQYYFNKYLQENPENKQLHFIVFKKNKNQDSKIQPHIMVILTKQYGQIHFEIRNKENKRYTIQNKAVYEIIKELQSKYISDLKIDLRCTDGLDELRQYTDSYETFSKPGESENYYTSEDGTKFTIRTTDNGGQIFFITGQQETSKFLLLQNTIYNINNNVITKSFYELLTLLIANDEKLCDCILEAFNNDIIHTEIAVDAIKVLVKNKKWYHLSQLLLNKIPYRNIQLNTISKELVELIIDEMIANNAPKSYFVKLMNLDKNLSEDQSVRQLIISKHSNDENFQKLLKTIGTIYTNIEAKEPERFNDAMNNKIDKFNKMLKELFDISSLNRLSQKIEIFKTVITLYSQIDKQSNNTQIRQLSTNINYQIKQILNIWFQSFFKLIKSKKAITYKIQIEDFLNFLTNKKNQKVLKKLIANKNVVGNLRKFFLWFREKENRGAFKFERKNIFWKISLETKTVDKTVKTEENQFNDSSKDFFEKLMPILQKIFTRDSIKKCENLINQQRRQYLQTEEVINSILETCQKYADRDNGIITNIYNTQINNENYDQDSKDVIEEVINQIQILANNIDVTFENIGQTKNELNQQAKVLSLLAKELKKKTDGRSTSQEQKTQLDLLYDAVRDFVAELNRKQTHLTDKIFKSKNIYDELEFQLNDDEFAKCYEDLIIKNNYLNWYLKIVRQSSTTSLLSDGLCRKNLIGTIWGICMQKIIDKYNNKQFNEYSDLNDQYNKNIVNATKQFNVLVNQLVNRYNKNIISKLLTLLTNNNIFERKKNNKKIDDELLNTLKMLVDKLLKKIDKNDQDLKLIDKLKSCLRKASNIDVSKLYDELNNFTITVSNHFNFNIDNVFNELEIYMSQNKKEPNEAYLNILVQLAKFLNINTEEIKEINSSTNLIEIENIFKKSDDYQKLEESKKKIIMEFIGFYYDSTAVDIGENGNRFFAYRRTLDDIIDNWKQPISIIAEKIRKQFNSRDDKQLQKKFVYMFLKLKQKNISANQLNHEYRQLRWNSTNPLSNQEYLLDLLVGIYCDKFANGKSNAKMQTLLKKCQEIEQKMYDGDKQIRFLKSNISEKLFLLAKILN